MSAPAPAERERMLALLERLVRVESPSGDTAAIAQVTGILRSEWEPLGAAVRIVDSPAGGHLVADLPGDGMPVLLVGHADTVWPVGTLAGALPLSREDGIIRGPGVYDMKSGLVVIDSALRTLAAAERRPAVRIFVGADEEVGSVHGRGVLAAAADGARAAIGFESPHPDGGLKSGRLGSVRARLRVRGRAAHAALDPGAGVSATEELVDALVRVREIVRTAPPAARLPVPLYNLGALDAPGQANVVSDAAEALLGFRFADDAQEQHVLGGIRSLPATREGAALELQILSHRPAWAAREEDTRLAEHITAASTATGYGPARPAAGAADTNLLAHAPFPVVDGFGPRGGGAHALSEHIVESSLWERAAQLTTFLRSL